MNFKNTINSISTLKINNDFEISNNQILVDMHFKDIINSIKILEINNISKAQINNFLISINQILANSNQFGKYTSTIALILLEGFYQSFIDPPSLKNEIRLIRFKAWNSHFGTPTIEFLLTYKLQILHIQEFFSNFSNYDYYDILPLFNQIETQKNNHLDLVNKVIINPDSINLVQIPDELESVGKFIKTYNQEGGFTTAASDIYSKQFIEYATTLKGKSIFLEIGAAFGVASLQASHYGAEIFCNDINTQNLAVIYKRFQKQTATQLNRKIELIPGVFPDELIKLPQKKFDAILICRVLHFFTGDKITQSLDLLKKLLKPGGRLFIVCETPYLKNWQKFIPEYEFRLKQCIKWPGEISNPQEFESSGRILALPKFVHWISKDILNNCLKESGFEVLESSYINRNGQFPDDLLLDGRESVGAIAMNN